MAIGVLLGLSAAWPACAGPPPAWLEWGGSLPGNQRDATSETVLTTANVGQLKTKWVFTARGNVGATPTVQGDDLYVTDDGGGLYRIDAATGTAIWSHLVSDYTGQGDSTSRSSPAIVGSLIIVTDRYSGNVLGIDRFTGALVWKTSVEANPSVLLTASPVVFKGVVYLGTSSNEEWQVSVSPSYVPSFQGAVVALNASTGHLLWRTPMVPSGYTGGGVWGSGFAISPARKTIYVTTGNNYTVPQAATDCLQSATGAAAQLACLDPADLVDAVVALDLATGAVKWSHRLQGADTYTLNCVSAAPVQPCPTPPGADFDFASAPNMLTLPGSGAELVGAGQKSGIYWALNPDTGDTVWATQAGPGGNRGGIMWGAAVGANDVFIAENNSGHFNAPYGQSGRKSTNGGTWAALDVATGLIKWQVAVKGKAPNQTGFFAGAEAPLTLANGIVFGGTTAGAMVAINAATGAALWGFASGGSVTCGPAVVNGTVYWGSGDPYNLPSNKLYAFSIR